jgi:hypothetical protein
LLAGFGIEGSNETANAVVASRSADNDFVFDNERGAGGAVVFVAFGVGDVPEKMSGASVEAEEMGVVGFEKNFGVPDGDAAIVVLGGVVDEAFADRARIVPDGAASAGIEGKGVVGGGDEQDAVHGYGCDFKATRVAYVKDPLRAEVGDVRGRDFCEIAEAAACVVAIVRDPVCARGLHEQVFGAHVDRGGNGGGRFFLPRGRPGAG